MTKKLSTGILTVAELENASVGKICGAFVWNGPYRRAGRCSAG